MWKKIACCVLVCSAFAAASWKQPVLALQNAPTTPADCQPWPVELAPMMAKLIIPEGVCLVREVGNPSPSEYRPKTRTVIYRNPAPTGGELGGIGHELCHADQHGEILKFGLPDIAKDDPDENQWLIANWSAIPKGQAYLAKACYSFLGIGGDCQRMPSPACWAVDRACCEMGFCLPEYRNPMEDNAQFCAVWHNPGNLPIWSRNTVIQSAPRRSEWATQWLP